MWYFLTVTFIFLSFFFFFFLLLVLPLQPVILDSWLFSWVATRRLLAWTNCSRAGSEVGGTCWGEGGGGGDLDYTVHIHLQLTSMCCGGGGGAVHVFMLGVSGFQHLERKNACALWYVTFLWFGFMGTVDPTLKTQWWITVVCKIGG